MWEGKGPKIAKTILKKKEKVESEKVYSDVKAYYIVKIIKAM